MTNAENLRRGNNFHASLTHCKYGHPFDAENTKHEVLRDGRHRRMCRKCRARICAENYQRRRARDEARKEAGNLRQA